MNFNGRTDMDTAERLLREARNQLRWCSGSPDFNEGGQARKGWIEGPQKILARIDTYLSSSESKESAAGQDTSIDKPETALPPPAPTVQKTVTFCPAQGDPCRQGCGLICKLTGEATGLIPYAAPTVPKEPKLLKAWRSKSDPYFESEGPASVVAYIDTILSLLAQREAGIQDILALKEQVHRQLEACEQRFSDLVILCKQRGMEVTAFECRAEAAERGREGK
mgnify:CR=1 FL=1